MLPTLGPLLVSPYFRTPLFIVTPLSSAFFSSHSFFMFLHGTYSCSTTTRTVYNAHITTQLIERRAKQG